MVRQFFGGLGLVLALAGTARSATVVGVYNTGLAVDGTALAAGNGESDAHWVVLSSSDRNITTGIAAKTFTDGWEPGDTPGSRNVNATGAGADGSFDNITVFRQTFSLVGYRAGTARLSGMALADDAGGIQLNGHWLSGSFGLGGLTPFATTDSTFFNPTVNTLDFLVYNDQGATLFRVDALQITASVPEPQSWALSIVGFGIVGAVMRTRRRDGRSTGAVRRA